MKIIFCLFLSGCALSISYKPTVMNTQALDTCRDFCEGSVYQLYNKDDGTYLCECYNDNNDVSKLGRINKEGKLNGF